MNIVDWLLLGSGVLIGFAGGWAWGNSYGYAKRKEDEIEFKRERLRPAHRANVSQDAVAEEDRPHARQSKGEIRPRAGRKRS